MKKLLANLKFTFIAILATGILLITQSAFKSSPNRDSNSYYFTGNSNSEMADSNNWVASSGSGEECRGIDLPCLVVLAEGQTINDYLNGKTDQEIIDGATTRKSQN